MGNTQGPAEVRIVRVQAVIQARSSDDEPWVDQGKISGIGIHLVAFDRVAGQYLKAYRESFPDAPQSRVIERTITHSDRVLEV